ncbi:MAG: 2-oxoglutarate ferredoxin oxidoreductase subunit alpha, partial [Phycisphaerae bacterium]|nr:2-oxoglutarate ferredoxin oxidoreductase subunit alpha [Phycisphaerae bacterium]
LKSEAIGLAVMTELPAVIIDVQRGGPCTGLPTKTEQSDLFQAVLGRNGECPLVVLAPSTPADCFDITVEAFRIAVRYMVPVIVLSDGYLSAGAEAWRVPQFKRLPPIKLDYASDPDTYQPYLRNKDLARPWAIPGTPKLMHRVGGLEKKDVTGEPSHDPMNHQKMVELRAAKVAGVKMEAPYRWLGDDSGDLLVVGWGSSYGAICAAVNGLRQEGLSVSACHLRCLNPLPEELGPKLRKFKQVLVPEMNLGQLIMLLRAKFLVDAKGIGKVQGRPFTIGELASGIRSALQGGSK